MSVVFNSRPKIKGNKNLTVGENVVKLFKYYVGRKYVKGKTRQRMRKKLKKYFIAIGD